MNRRHLVAAALFVLTLLVFWRATGFDFIGLDDEIYVSGNPYIRQGVTAQSVNWAFSAAHQGYWIPLTWCSYMADSDAWGPGPRGYHAANILLHAANVVLLFLVLSRMTAALWPSAMVAALFALHPLRLEAVVWIAQRKDVLSTLFWLLGIAAYVGYTKRPGVLRYVSVATCLVLGLLAKPMLVTFPFLLLVLDVWPLQRRGRLVLEKLPLMAVVTVFSVATYVTQKASGAVKDLESVSLIRRLMGIPLSYVRYMGKLFWPHNMSVRYPAPEAYAVAPAVVASIGLLAITAFAIWQLRRRPYLATGWFWFLGTLVPVIGLVQIGQASFADRFTYFPCVGFFVVLVWGAAEILPSWPYRACAAVAALLACAAVTRSEMAYWKDEETLFRHALAVTSDNYVAYNSLGRALERKGRVDEALVNYEASLRIAPGFNEALVNNGNVLARQGRYDEAFRCFEAARKRDPRDARLLNNYGSMLFQAGRRDEGLALLAEAVTVDPSLSDAHFNYGLALLQVGRNADALAHFHDAARIDPSDASAASYVEQLRRR